MRKRSTQVQQTMYCGINVGARSLTVPLQYMHQPVEQKGFPNNPIGHRALIVWLRKAKSPVRVSLVASRCDPHAKAFFESLWLERKPVYKRSLLLPGSCYTQYMDYSNAD
jgi:hypothetical protein